MTRAQHQAFERLRRKVTNPDDVTILEVTDGAVTIFVAFPPMYLIYGNDGALLRSETIAQRRAAGKRLAEQSPPGESAPDDAAAGPLFSAA